MCLYHCEFCGVLCTECVCDRCHTIKCEDFETLEQMLWGRQERHHLDEVTARAQLELQLDNPL